MVYLLSSRSAGTAVTERAAAKPIESREQASTGGELAYSDIGFDFATQLQKTEVYSAAAQRKEGRLGG